MLRHVYFSEKMYVNKRHIDQQKTRNYRWSKTCQLMPRMSTCCWRVCLTCCCRVCLRVVAASTSWGAGGAWRRRGQSTRSRRTGWSRRSTCTWNNSNKTFITDGQQKSIFTIVYRIRIFSIPDPGSELFPSRIPDPKKEFKYFNPKKWFLSYRKYDSGCSSRIRILTLPIPDPGVNRIRIRPTMIYKLCRPHIRWCWHSSLTSYGWN